MTPPPGSVNPRDWRRPTRRYNYDSAGYWQEVGRPLIEEALASDDGFRPDLFDSSSAARQWLAAPDLLVIAHLLPAALNN